MKKIYTLLILVISCILCPHYAHAIKSCDIAPYGIQHPSFPCEAFIQSLGPCERIKIAVLLNTFIANPQNPGYNPNACLQRVLAESRTAAVEYHLINERCSERAGGCARGEFMAGLPQSSFYSGLARRDKNILYRTGLFATQQAGKVMPLMRDSNQICWVSPVLESRMGQNSFVPLAEIAYFQFFQRCNLVYNPLSNVGHPGRFIYEVHSEAPRITAPCIADLDGVDIDLQLRNPRQRADRRAAANRMISEKEAVIFLRKYQYICNAAYLHIGEMNGKGKNSPASPPLRNNWPTREMFDRLVGLYPSF